MCGIAGIVSQTSNVNSELFDALTMLQHRGQDAAGIITNDADRLYLRKENGLVRDVFNKDEHMQQLRGPMGVGRCTWTTIIAAATTTRRSPTRRAASAIGASCARAATQRWGPSGMTSPCWSGRSSTCVEHPRLRL